MLGASWSMLRHAGRVLEHSRSALGAYWEHAGACWGHAGACWERAGLMLGACWSMLGACWEHLRACWEHAGSVQVRAPPPVTRPGSRGMAKSGDCLFCESPFSVILGPRGTPGSPRIIENGDSQNHCVCVCRRRSALRGRPEKGTTDPTLTQISGVAPPGQLPINRPWRPLCYIPW